MIKIEKVEVFGFEAAIRGCRNPMNSWDKSDSRFVMSYEMSKILELNPYGIGDNDLKLMKNLVKAGTDHSKFMRMINVTMDVTAPLYWWKELDTYKVGTVANSCSTMHKIHEKEFTLDDFSHEHLETYHSEAYVEWDFKNYLDQWVELLNVAREAYLKTNDKTWWWQMIQLLPSSYNQKRTIQLNYAVLRNIYHARKNHKLDEWKAFCEWIESLPYSELITL